jgi:hypothetical protein
VLNETYGEVRIGKHLSDNFPIRNDLKQGDALLAMFFKFALEYDIGKVQENQVGLKLNGTHRLLAYADDMNLLRGNIDSVKESALVRPKGLGKFKISPPRVSNPRPSSCSLAP